MAAISRKEAVHNFSFVLSQKYEVGEEARAHLIEISLAKLQGLSKEDLECFSVLDRLVLM